MLVRATYRKWGCPGGDDLPFVYSGTLMVQGHGIACVRAIGSHTEIGKIGKALQTVEIEETPLQKETNRLVRYLAGFGIFLVCACRGSISDSREEIGSNGFLAGITLAMAMLPEEFPVVLTVFMALGAWRISQKQVLTRRVPAVESLGAATVLCVDKTGTLTLNQMSPRRLFAGGQLLRHRRDVEAEPLPEAFHELVEFSILASQNDPFRPDGKSPETDWENATSSGTEHIHGNWVLVHQYPLSQALLSLVSRLEISG